MKRLGAVLLLLAMCLQLSACGHFVNIMPGTEPVVPGATPLPEDEQEGDFEPRPLFEFLRWDSFASSYYQDTPAALSCRIGGEGAYDSPVFDRTSIIAACDALRSMTVTGRANPDPTSPETVFTFTMDDGDQLSLTFQGGLLKLNSGAYSLEGGGSLWSLVFPGYSNSFDVFDLYFNSSIREFADNFSVNTPVSVGRRFNGGATLTSKDPEIVNQVFAILSAATVDRVEMSPDQNIDLTQTTDYVFTMADASYYTFSFAGQCLAVTASGAYGPVYYWLTGTDELASIPVVPESTLPTFEGGPLTNLREDVAQAADAANGISDVTVVSVYVDYELDGKHAYLTLDGDTAVNFTRQIVSITAEPELVEAGTGSAMTVFITLSDQSGPILTFAGDTVQQLVGMNYPCDAGAMENLRNTIRTLAQDEKNIGYIAGESTG